MDSFFKKENRYPCPPNVNTVKKDAESYETEAFVLEEDDLEEIKQEAQTVISCVEDYLNLYNLFVTGNPPSDSLVKEIYDKTNKMIKQATHSRKRQKDVMMDKVKEYEEQIAMYCDEDTGENAFCEGLKDAVFYGHELEKAFKYDFQVLNELNDSCKKANNKSDRIVCVEKFVNTAHERGPYIPLGCGGYLQEILSNDMEQMEDLSLIEVITPELEEETFKVLNCLKNYKP